MFHFDSVIKIALYQSVPGFKNQLCHEPINWSLELTFFPKRVIFGTSFSCHSFAGQKITRKASIDIALL